MNILFTGASSFTGMWFVKELVKSGHQVTATLFRPVDSYSGTRKERVNILKDHAEICESCSFGDEKFIEIIKAKDHWDVLCHHAADVTNYKSSSFDYLNAVRNNTYNLEKVIEILKEKNCRKIVLTGSVFEQREGQGSDNLRAVSPYGLSKGLTSDVFEFLCSTRDISLGKFVIPNPFGPYEEERFIAFLMKTWFSGKTANVTHPDYIRDNIHVSLLAKAYAKFVSSLPSGPTFTKINPSGYVGPQGDFSVKFSEAMRSRVPYACNLNLLQQEEFPEPLERINTDPVDIASFDWNEEEAWDEIAAYYSRKLETSIQKKY